MEDIWNQLDFGGKQRRLEETSEVPSGEGEPVPPSPAEEKESTFDPSFFAPPSRNVKLLRELSMRGKADMELMLEQTKGRPKLIWGEPEAYIDQVESDGALTENEVVEASKMGGELLIKYEEAVPIDEDIKVNEITASVADYTQAEDKGR